MDIKKVNIIIAVILMQVLLNALVDTRPGKLYETPARAPTTGCTLKSEVEELCQQCAKHTKSNVVYPMCCSDTEDARDYCVRFLNFGLH